MKKYILLFILLLYVNSSFSKGMFTVKHYNMDNGLAHNMNNGIVQDDKGYIWIATWNGIDKFDGYTFRNFKSYPNDIVKLPNNRIEGLHLNSRNNFWVRTYGQQIYLFNTKTEKFENVFTEKSQPLVNAVFCLKNGISWIVSENNILYRICEDNYKKGDGITTFNKSNYPYLGTQIYDIYLDSEENEWVLSNKGITIVGEKKVSNNIPFKYITETDYGIFLASQNGYVTTYSSNGQLRPLNLPFKIDCVNRLKKLNNKDIAIVTPENIIIYNTKDNSVKYFSAPEGEEFIASEKLYFDSNGVLWHFASGNTIVRYDTNTNDFQVLNYPDLSKEKLTYGHAFFFHEDNYGKIWILLREGILCKYNENNQNIEIAYYHTTEGNLNYYAVSGRSHYIDTHNNLWVGTREGFDQLLFSQKTYERIYSGTNDEVRGLFQDKHNRLWLGIKNGKVKIYDDKNKYIGNLNSSGEITENSNAVFGANVYCFYQDEDNNLWLGSRDEGLFVLKPKSINKYDVTQFKPTEDPFSISSLSVFSIFQDSQKRIWIGTYGGGLNLIEFDSNKKIEFIHAGNLLKNYPITQCANVRHVYQSKNGTILVGTSSGLISFSSIFESPEEITFYRNFCTANRKNCLSNSDVLQIYQDKNENIYVSTFSGGVDITSDSPQLLSEEIHFKNLNKTNGLISDLSLSVIEDKKGYIWIASVKAFNRFDLVVNRFDYFNQYNLNMSFTLTEAVPIIDYAGNLVFGTLNGAIRILIDQFQYSKFSPPIVFTGIYVQKKDINKEPETIMSDKPVLNPSQRNITISFAALDYTNPQAIDYAYRLKNNPKNDWIYIDKNRSVDFIELPPGEHVFQVKSTNGDGFWMDNESELKIVVKPTFWETKFARVIYFILMLLIVFLAVLIITHIFNLRKQVDFQQELTRLKLKFFTDISHELRTPLTLITAPVDEVIKHENLSDSGKENMQTVKQNSDRLLKLINQLLDFRKIQNNKMKIYLEKTDVQKLSEDIFQSFYSMAHQKNIEYTINKESESAFIYTDIDKFEKILFNLLSNAFKHTPDGKKIILDTKTINNEFVIQIVDEGSGFDVRKAEQLFHRFETNNSSDSNISTGIGLSLVKELVTLLHGKIKVKSIKGVGSVFTVHFPMDFAVDDQDVELILNDSDEQIINDEIDIVINESEDEKEEVGNKEITILIIEDNDELRNFIKKILIKKYNILEAPNGKIGLELTHKHLPDIVISDIMMPEMDGIEYLKAVKTNNDISHIPIILLTAKSAIEDRIEAIEYGADSYITKPFSANYLKTCISSLIKVREQLRDYYLLKSDNLKVQIQPSQEWEPSIPQITNYDDEFINNVIVCIEENISKTDFKIDIIAENMHMSRSVFYRKIKAIVGLSPIDFVKNIRIKRAIQLLETKQFTISEISYQSGFTSPQYMSKIFREIAGCSPTEYLKKTQKNK